jgi:hypothetical protein
MNRHPWEALPKTAATHFKLSFYATVLEVMHHALESSDSPEGAFARFPFLVQYNNELAANGLAGVDAGRAVALWTTWLGQWEATVPGHLPLRALRSCGIDREAAGLLLAAGLVEEDARFGQLFESLQGGPGHTRPTMALVASWSQATGRGDLRVDLRRLLALGLLRVTNPEAPRPAWALAPEASLWDALKGEWSPDGCPWAIHRPVSALASLDSLVLTPAVRASADQARALLAAGELDCLVLRGARHNGRRSVAGAVARALGHGLLEVDGTGADLEQRQRLAGALAVLLDAVPCLALEPAAGERIALAAPEGGRPYVLVVGREGRVGGPGLDRSVTVTVDVPGPDDRARLWARSLDVPEVVAEVSGACRLTSGNIQRAGRAAQAQARAAGRSVTVEDVRAACRSLDRGALATPVSVAGAWSRLVVGAETMRELHELEQRCRHRERLAALFPGGPARLTCGVRALLSGPSGTGKTLAAQVLAAVLGMDLYRVDLSTVVDKYLGETEKNLHRIFARAEELDVILLLDEGDALLTQRTAVQTSHDRYANLETNYLLQRIESYEGVLLVTTNAPDRIDTAFQRRMDVTVELNLPGPAERWGLWQLHLPPRHQIADTLLRDAAVRCALSGAQIRNAALHATLLGLDDGGVPTSHSLKAALEREYRKLSAACPMRWPHDLAA